MCLNISMHRMKGTLVALPPTTSSAHTCTTHVPHMCGCGTPRRDESRALVRALMHVSRRASAYHRASRPTARLLSLIAGRAEHQQRGRRRLVALDRRGVVPQRSTCQGGVAARRRERRHQRRRKCACGAWSMPVRLPSGDPHEKPIDDRTVRAGSGVEARLGQRSTSRT